MTATIAQAPFYLDWKFWSFVVAALALCLSQLPPLHILFRRKRMEVEAYSQMHLSHRIGNPNVQLHLILNNTGGREIRVRGIELAIKRGTDESFVVPAKNYYQKPADKETVLLTPFKLKPGEEWAHVVNFLNFFSRQDERLYKQLESNLRLDIGTKRLALVDKNTVVEADDANVIPLIGFFTSKFRWKDGEYEMTLRADTEPPGILKDSTFRFTLFESDSAELIRHTTEYKFGWGVFLPSGPDSVGIFVPIAEK
jgi:hypothetical protein